MINPLISVILPTYNRISYLPRAINSVLEQGYQNLELIIVDDGSTDPTPEYIASLKDSRIHYLNRVHNLGIGFTRAEGVNAAKGELIAFIDSDDMWLPGKLDKQISIFQSFPEVAMLFGDYTNVNHKENRVANGFSQTSRGISLLGKQPMCEDTWKINAGFPQSILIANYIATSSVLFRSIVINHVGNFNITLSGPEDIEFWWRVGLSNQSVAYTTQILIQRDKNETSISGQELAFIPLYLQALDICIDNSRKAGRDDLITDLNKAQQKAWGALLHAYALAGRRQLVWDAFRNTLRYGLSVRYMLYLLAGFAGPKAIAAAKRSHIRI